MTTPDIKQLVDRLDNTCLDFLDKASRFCVQHQHSEVSMSHYLLQMIGESSNGLTRLLVHHDIDPLAIIKMLLQRSERYKSAAPRNPVFSRDLLTWLEIASGETPSQADRTIGQIQLLVALMNHRRLYRAMGVKAFDQLTKDDIVTFLGNREDSVPINPLTDNGEVEQESTMIISEQEILSTPLEDAHTMHIEGYGDLHKIGTGGMATVYQAKHLGLDRDVALKVLNPGAGEDFINRFMREARIVARLSHPNIIQIYDVNQSDNQTYLTMEFITGGELSERMGSTFSLAETLPVLTQVLQALQSAHDKGFIHRDIKPANILFRKDGSVVLTDFGIARAVTEDTGLTIAGSILGTPRYMSPEQARGVALDHRSDLYSVGVLFFQMLEGDLPFTGDSAMGIAMKHILDPVPKLSTAHASLQGFIDKAMAKEADDRFQSGKQMIAELNQL